MPRIRQGSSLRHLAVELLVHCFAVCKKLLHNKNSYVCLHGLGGRLGHESQTERSKRKVGGGRERQNGDKVKKECRGNICMVCSTGF